MNPRLLPYTPERDVYRLLGVPPSASAEDINVACRRLARTFHPDHNRSGRATQEMQVVNAVRRVLTDPESRAVYDRERMRFHSDLRRAPVLRPQLSPRPAQTVRRADPPPPPPATVVPARPSPLRRYLRAALIGARAMVGGLTPRCSGCRTVIDGTDAYCAACGTPLLTTGA